MRRWLISLLLVACAGARAEPTRMLIPEQGWQVSFDAPTLTKVKEASKSGQYMYVGTADRFNLSLYVETPGCAGGETHEANFNCFWPNARRNPMIDQQSVRTTSAATYYKVEYDIKAPFQGKTITQRNINFLFAYRGKWMDLHVSILEPTAGDLQLLKTFEDSLSYGE